MPYSSQKIELSENHRRAVSIVMRGVESACAEILEWLVRPSSVLIDVRADLIPNEQARLRELAERLRTEVREFAEKVSLDKRRMSSRRSVAAIVSAALVDLQEVQASELKGYGILAEDPKRVLDESINSMMTLFEEMRRIAEAK